MALPWREAFSPSVCGWGADVGHDYSRSGKVARTAQPGEPLTEARIWGDLDRMIRSASVDRLRDLALALSARLAEVTARLACAREGRIGRQADENLDVRHAAHRLGVSTSWLYREAHRLPFAVRIGRRVLFSARGLEQWSREQGRT